jgi:hypothetical protein
MLWGNMKQHVEIPYRSKSGVCILKKVHQLLMQQSLDSEKQWLLYVKTFMGYFV